MKLVQALNLLIIATCVYTSAAAQCTGNCPSGSLSMPTSSATLAAGSTYCISTTTNLSGNSYTINGTLVIQAGTVTLGNITLEKTGVILVKNAAKLIITGIFNGNSTAPVSTIDNLIICNGGLLNMTGSFSQGQINIAVNDFGSLQVTGAWTAGAPSSTVKIGRGAVIELCASFSLNKDGFFTETSTAASYLITHSSLMASGWLSSMGNSSKINWTAEGPAANYNHPTAYTCLFCGNYNLAPTGTNSTCGSAANALYNQVLFSPDDKPAIRSQDDNTNKLAIYPNPAKKYLYLQLPKKYTYTHLSIFSQAAQLVYQTTVKAGSSPTRYDLPAQLPPGIYFVQLTGNESATTLRLAKD
ncbi:MULTISPECIES: T9SS type A sorting domain-containing protein [Niastella]|uniref:T9SS type A sorting domain-containing protein n=1 Tax=Niastella soli TaxID=2821487 RepID=A0ABS3Z0S9_9BACT|nr:T9SS type A sorting domain-containing protein [Niastella soli]MBO9203776.1 T9SS type A sorting domain-containing protein [Niastella soli]